MHVEQLPLKMKRLRAVHAKSDDAILPIQGDDPSYVCLFRVRRRLMAEG